MTSAKQNEQLSIETIIATLNEVNATLARRHAAVKAMKGSWTMRALGIVDAMEIVEGMRQRVIMDVMSAIEHAKARPVGVGELPEGLVILTPEEVAARESKPVETETEA